MKSCSVFLSHLCAKPQKSTASSRRNRSLSGPPTMSPRETMWWTSACPPPRMVRGGANCSAVRTCNPWQPPLPASAPPSHLGQLVIEIHSVGLLLSAWAAISSQSPLCFRRESDLSCFKRSVRERRARIDFEL